MTPIPTLSVPVGQPVVVLSQLTFTIGVVRQLLSTDEYSSAFFFHFAYATIDRTIDTIEKTIVITKKMSGTILFIVVRSHRKKPARGGDGQ
mmetsp:Transcript_10888/g.17444  ORF Transcript_10888/g.17444 Transcript_10888/m.17444 type:complete len:91 (+) Transcript_10888:1425-1697(+)